MEEKKQLAKAEKTWAIPVWAMVKGVEENISANSTDTDRLNEIVATLLANFGTNNKGRYPVLISADMLPIAMLITVLEHFILKTAPAPEPGK